MPQVKVWNENTHPYEETFRERHIKIAPKSYVLMDEEEAELFYGTFKAPMRDVDNQHSPKGYKMLRIERGNSGAAPRAESHVCPVCAYAGASPEDLEEHTDANHLDQMVDQKEAQDRRSAKGKGK